MKPFLSFCAATAVLLLSTALALAAPLAQIYHIVEVHAVDPVDSLQLRTKGLYDIGPFLNDPYFAYLTPEDYSHLLNTHLGAYGGIGTVIHLHDGRLTVWSVKPSSPAQAAGLRFGDEIIAVNGQDVRGLSVLEAAALLRGLPGSAVAVDIQRNGETHTVTMLRAAISIPTVRGYMNSGVAVVEISAFTANTPREFRAVLRELRSLLPSGLVLDLRGNPGGSLPAVLEIAEQLIPAGPVVRLFSRQDHEIVFVTANTPAPLPYLALLIDEETASAAEILAGAVQDSGAGRVVGTRSYGKGTVQSIFRLTDGGGLRLTTARFSTPSGRPINNYGIMPNIEIGDANSLNFAVNLARDNTAHQIIFTMGRHEVRAHRDIKHAAFPPFLDSSRAYVPLRLLAEALGYRVEWDAEDFAAVVHGEGLELVIPLRGSTMYLNGNAIKLPAPVLVRSDRAFLPVRTVAEILGARVYWDNDARQVVVAW